MTALIDTVGSTFDGMDGLGLAIHQFPCTGQPVCSEPLVLVHGWASDSRVWQLLRDLLSERYHLLTLDLPGFGDSPVTEYYDKQQLLELMGAVLPERFLLLGWALGGMLAVEFAARFPGRVCALITVGSNASFVQRPDWPSAMEQTTFDNFCQLFETNPALCLKRFNGLQVKGERDERRVLTTLRQQLPATPEIAQLQNWRQALALLGELDQRQLIASLDVPALFVFAEGDSLVPVDTANHSLYLGSGKRVAVLKNCGHALPLTCTEQLASEIDQFIVQQNRKLDKQLIAQSFSRAASSYDRVARLQRETGRELFEQIPPDIAPRRILDLGCGTGYFSRLLQQRFPDAEIVALDLAEGMVRYARENLKDSCQLLCGDAESLPLADNSFDLVYSNLVLQWCEDLSSLSSELLRILSPGGLLLYTSLGPDTLHELRVAWAAVDEAVHVNRFPPANALGKCLDDTGCTNSAIRQQRKVLHYSQLRDLTAELKGLGAHNINQGRRTSITGRTRIAGLLKAYEQFRMADGMLPASWDVVYGRVENL